MDNAKLILNQPVCAPELLQNLQYVKNAPRKQKEEFARGFEAIFIDKLLQQMNKTSQMFGVENDSAHKQITLIFNQHLAQYMGDNGGFGFWKQIIEAIPDADNQNTNPDSKSVDETL